ncbi:hypothetical protein [Chryseobacterium sp. P1-3]
MCVSTDGFLDDLRVENYSELQSKSIELQNYGNERTYTRLSNLLN